MEYWVTEVGSYCDWVVREGSSEEVTFEKRPEWWENKWCEEQGKSGPSRRNKGTMKDVKSNKLEVFEE